MSSLPIPVVGVVVVVVVAVVAAAGGDETSSAPDGGHEIADAGTRKGNELSNESRSMINNDTIIIVLDYVAMWCCCRGVVGRCCSLLCACRRLSSLFSSLSLSQNRRPSPTVRPSRRDRATTSVLRAFLEKLHLLSRSIPNE